MLQRPVFDLGRQAVFFGQILHRPPDRMQNLFRLHRFELKHGGAGEDRVVDIEIGVLGGGGDQRDLSIFDEFQQRLLLLFGEILDLVEIQQRAARRQEGVELADNLLDIGQAGRRGVQLIQRPLGLGCNRGFPRAGRAVKDQVRDIAGLHDPAQKPLFAQNMALAAHLAELLGAKLICQWTIHPDSPFLPATYPQ